MPQLCLQMRSTLPLWYLLMFKRGGVTCQKNSRSLVGYETCKKRFLRGYTPGGGDICSIHDGEVRRISLDCKFPPSVFFGVKSTVTYFFRSKSCIFSGRKLWCEVFFFGFKISGFFFWVGNMKFRWTPWTPPPPPTPSFILQVPPSPGTTLRRVAL